MFIIGLLSILSLKYEPVHSPLWTLWVAWLCELKLTPTRPPRPPTNATRCRWRTQNAPPPMMPTNRGTRRRLHDLPRSAAAEPRDGRRLDAAGRATASTTCPAGVTAGTTLPRQPRRPGLRRLCFAPPPPDASRSPARSAQQVCPSLDPRLQFCVLLCLLTLIPFKVTRT